MHIACIYLRKYPVSLIKLTSKVVSLVRSGVTPHKIRGKTDLCLTAIRKLSLNDEVGGFSWEWIDLAMECYCVYSSSDLAKALLRGAYMRKGPLYSEDYWRRRDGLCE